MTSTMRFFAAALTFASMLAALSGCAAKGTAAREAASRANSGLSEAVLFGKVVETMDSGGYTYVLLEQEGKSTWAALPLTPVRVGQEIRIYGGAKMEQFASKALNRTFDSIIFSGGVVREPEPTGAPETAAPGTEEAKVEKPVLAGKIVETMRAGSYTYVYLEKDGRKTWSAIPATEVKVGDEIELVPGIDMVNFRSTKLNRVFPYINFSGGIKGAAAAAPAEAPQQTEPAKGLPEGHPGTAPAQPARPPVIGKVAETFDSGGYTYIRLESDGVQTWAAVPRSKVAAGEEVTLPAGNAIKGFHSRTLNRTFDSIVFTGPPISGGQPAGTATAH